MTNFSASPRNPPARMLRQFAILSLLVFGGFGVWRWIKTGPDAGALLLLVAAAYIGIGGCIAPRTIRWVFVGWMTLVFPIGWLVSHTVLTMLYFGLFTPIGLVFRAMGRDRLMRFSRGSGSFWAPRRQSEDAATYLHQF